MSNLIHTKLAAIMNDVTAIDKKTKRIKLKGSCSEE